MKQIALIFGGKSGEHEVSIKTAFSILQAVDYTNCQFTPVYVSIDGEWSVGEKVQSRPEDNRLFSDFASYTKLGDFITFFQTMDAAFPVIHGPNGEDGSLQGLLEMMNIPYVGSDVISSALGMDKEMMKIVFAEKGIPQGPFLSFRRDVFEMGDASIIRDIERHLAYPVFVKPANLGSSIGISKAKNRSELQKALQTAFRFDRKIVVEATIIGRELEIGVLGHRSLLTSEVGEIVTTKDFYDYEAKYENQSVTDLRIPADVPGHVKDRMATLAKQAFQTLGCSGLSRVDFFWEEETDTLYINEINTMPGFTPLSMYPMLFKEAGIPYSQLIEKLLALAVEKHAERERNQIQAFQEERTQ